MGSDGSGGAGGDAWIGVWGLGFWVQALGSRAPHSNSWTTMNIYSPLLLIYRIHMKDWYCWGHTHGVLELPKKGLLWQRCAYGVRAVLEVLLVFN